MDRMIGPAAATPQTIPLEVIRQALTTVAECVRVVAEERTKQTRIIAHRDVLIAEIAARRDVLLFCAEKLFGERQTVLAGLFDKLDGAVASHDPEAVSQFLGGIVELTKHSPLPELSALYRKFEERDYVLDLSADD